MANTNCLDGMRCPKCGSYGPFYITVTATAEVWDSGVEDYTDIEWEDDSACVCKACGCIGMVMNFQEKV